MTEGSGFVRTVLGDIPANQIGVTLVHEHLWMDATPILSFHGHENGNHDAVFDHVIAAECRWTPGAHIGNYQLTDMPAILADVVGAKANGVSTIVDVTPIDMGRSPQRLKEVSVQSGVHVVMGTGYYLHAAHQAHLPSDRAEDAVFERIVSEHVNGVDGIHPGIIGEIGTGNPPHDSELAVLRGAARAAAATGLALSIHVHPWGYTGNAILASLNLASLDPRRVILGHMNTAIDRPQYVHDLLESGVTVGFDLFGFDHSLLQVGHYPPSDWDVAKFVAGLLDAGYADRIVLSQDVGVRTRLSAFGGWGYAHLTQHVVPMLHTFGVDDAVLSQMLVTNCENILAMRTEA